MYTHTYLGMLVLTTISTNTHHLATLSQSHTGKPISAIILFASSPHTSLPLLILPLMPNQSTPKASVNNHNLTCSTLPANFELPSIVLQIIALKLSLRFSPLSRSFSSLSVQQMAQHSLFFAKLLFFVCTLTLPLSPLSLSTFSLSIGYLFVWTFHIFFRFIIELNFFNID